MSENHVGMISTDRGPNILNGLNLMAMIVEDPSAAGSLEKAMFKVHEQHNVSFNQLFSDLEDALQHIRDFSKLAIDCGAEHTKVDMTDGI